MNTSEKPARKPAKKSERKVAPAQTRNAGGVSYVPTPAAWKGDAGKVRLDLLPFLALEDVARVLAYGAEKYSEGGWRRLPDGRRRYIRAGMRHLFAHLRGEVLDEGSQLPHLAHAACSLLFALELPASGGVK